MRLILASASPRRKELLERVGITPYIIPSSADESKVKAESAEELALLRARIKAFDVQAKEKGEFVVIGADTVVEKDGVIYGKPNSDEDAMNMLRRLSGGSHNVYTAVVLIDSYGHTKECVDKSVVTFADFDPKRVESYIAKGLYIGKAGGYGIQDEELDGYVTLIEGEKDNVIGLPVKSVIRLLEGEKQWQQWK